MNPYQRYISEIRNAILAAGRYPLGGLHPSVEINVPENARRVLLFSPHPDDECITGGLPLRLHRELKFKVINVAITLGSDKGRRRERYDELEGACGYLGFDLIKDWAQGEKKITPAARRGDPVRWERLVCRIAAIISVQKPLVIFYPHQADGHATHKGTSLLVLDALKRIGRNLSCYTVETEYWRPMNNPNLLVEIGETDVSDLIAALSFHRGEVQRNPYHLSLPAWMLDNVRRGSEMIDNIGGKSSGFMFASIYRLRKWEDGHFIRASAAPRKVSVTDSLAEAFQTL